jgi:hypothetical protein
MRTYTLKPRVTVGVARKIEPSLLKARNAKRNFKFAPLSPVNVQVAGYLKKCSNKQKNEPIVD